MSKVMYWKYNIISNNTEVFHYFNYERYGLSTESGSMTWEDTAII